MIPIIHDTYVKLIHLIHDTYQERIGITHETLTRFVIYINKDRFKTF